MAAKNCCFNLYQLTLSSPRQDTSEAEVSEREEEQGCLLACWALQARELAPKLVWAFKLDCSYSGRKALDICNIQN